MCLLHFPHNVGSNFALRESKSIIVSACMHCLPIYMLTCEHIYIYMLTCEHIYIHACAVCMDRLKPLTYYSAPCYCICATCVCMDCRILIVSYAELYFCFFEVYTFNMCLCLVLSTLLTIHPRLQCVSLILLKSPNNHYKYL